MSIPDAHKTIIENWHLEVPEVTDLGYKLLDATDTRNITGCHTPSIQLDYDDLAGNQTGLARWRLYDPSKVPAGADPRKYTSKGGAPVSLFLPRGLRRAWSEIAKNPKKRIYVTEGEAKALYAAVRHNLACIGVQGMSGWQAKGVPAEQFSWFNWTDRPVIVIPDSDYQRNPDIRRWFARLGAHLASLGARVSFKLLPDLIENFNLENPNKRKTGLDDWFHHTGADIAAFKELPTLPIDHNYIQSWDTASSTLPEAFRSLAPVDPKWLDEAPPQPEYILAPYLQTNEVAQFAGQAGVSKSTWTMYAAASLTSGLPFFDIPIKQACGVLYCMLERHTNSFRRRWHKICGDVLARVPEDEPGTLAKAKKHLKANYYPKALAGQNMCLIQSKGKQWVMTPLVDELIAYLKAAGIKVVIFDPLSRLHEGDEDGATMSELTKAFEYIVQHTGVSIVFVHHSGKDASAKGGKYAGRGASQLTDNTSETVAFEEYSPKDRARAGRFTLKPGEENDFIVCAEHTRCSDGRTADPMYLVRNRDTGLLRRIYKLRDDDGDDVARLLANSVQFQRWAASREFTQTEFVKSRTVTLPAGTSERGAKALFAAALNAGVFKSTGDRKGFPTVRWGDEATPPDKTAELSSAARHSRTTAPLKKGGQKHAAPLK